MRKAGDVCFAEVSRDSEGTPSFWFVLAYHNLLCVHWYKVMRIHVFWHI